eukprot:SAG31_NODE_555_length_14169_cov_19.798721_7_plen_65_part_00
MFQYNSATCRKDPELLQMLSTKFSTPELLQMLSTPAPGPGRLRYTLYHALYAYETARPAGTKFS